MTTNKYNLLRLAKNSLWSVTSTIFAQGSSFIALTLAARSLDKSSFGELAVIQNTVAAFGVFAGLALSTTVSKFTAEFHSQKKDKTGKIISGCLQIATVLSSLIGVLLFVFSGIISRNLFHNNAMSGIIEICGLLIFFNIVNGIYNGILSGLSLYNKISKINLISGLFKVGSVFFLTKHFGVNGAVIAFIISSFLNLLFLNAVTSKILVINKITYNIFSNASHVIKFVLNFSLPALISQSLIIPINWVCITFLLQYSDNGFKEIASYQAALIFQSIIILVSYSVNSPLLTLLSSNKSNANFIDKINIWISWAISTYLAIPILFFPEITTILLGEKYNSNNYFNVLNTTLLTSLVITFKQGIQRTLIVKNLLWSAFYRDLLWAITAVILSYFLVENGALGLAISFLLAHIVSSIFIIHYSLKKNFICILDIFKPEIAINILVFTFNILFPVINISFIMKIIMVLSILSLNTFFFIKRLY